MVSDKFHQRAVDTLNNTLDQQVNFSINAQKEPATIPNSVLDADDNGNTLDNFEQWLDEHWWQIDYGHHHMLLVETKNLDFYSQARGRMLHDPTEYDSSDNLEFARSVVNTSTSLIGKNRYKNSVMHEFAHTCLLSLHCPYLDASDPMQEHSCGGVIHEGFWKGDLMSPMLIANSGKIPNDEQCVHDGSANGYTTSITSCTNDALEGYHDVY